MHRLEDQVEGVWIPHLHPSTYEAHDANRTRPKLLFGAQDDVPELLSRIVQTLAEPYLLLYVLHTTRGEAEAGRYQSEPLDAKALTDLIATFGNYLRSDGRFDFWIYSETDGATVVLDRHNYVHAYGPIADYTKILEQSGYMPGEMDRISQRSHMHF